MDAKSLTAVLTRIAAELAAAALTAADQPPVPAQPAKVATNDAGRQPDAPASQPA